MFRASINTIFVVVAFCLCGFNTWAAQVTNELVSSTSVEALPACGDYVQAFNEYTQKIEGKLVKKYSVFEITDWSRNSRYQGLLLTDKAPSEFDFTLEIQLAKKVNKVVTRKSSPFSQDKKYRVIDIQPEKLLSSAPSSSGEYRVKLSSRGKVLCSDRRLIYNDGD